MSSWVLTESKLHSVFMVGAWEECNKKVGTLYPGEYKKRTPCPVCEKLGVEVTRWETVSRQHNIVVWCPHCKFGGMIMDLYTHGKHRNHAQTKKAIEQALLAMPTMVMKELMGDG